MIKRQEALQIIEKNVENKNIIKHMFALEAVMGALYDYLKGKNEIGETKEEWMMAGLLHDGDYSQKVPVERQGLEISQWVKDEGYDISEATSHAMAAHNWKNTQVEPKSIMDWAIFSADSLTGLIVACALVIPSRKLLDVSVDMILKKFKQKSFAGGTRREDIALCEEKLNISLYEFTEISLKAMQSISSEIGL